MASTGFQQLFILVAYIWVLTPDHPLQPELIDLHRSVVIGQV
jgi:hypothetical protein